MGRPFFATCCESTRGTTSHKDARIQEGTECLAKASRSTAERKRPKKPHEHLWSCKHAEVLRGSASAQHVTGTRCTGAVWQVTRSRSILICENRAFFFFFFPLYCMQKRPGLWVLVGGFISRGIPNTRSGLWLWALGVFRRGAVNSSVHESGGSGEVVNHKLVERGAGGRLVGF